MLNLLLLSLSVLLIAVPSHAAEPSLDGAFIQLDEHNRKWSSEKWALVLGRAHAARCDTLVIQYLRRRVREVPPTVEDYLPHHEGDADPVETILKYADAQPGMTVWIGLRFDERLMGSELLNSPAQLRAALQDELPRNVGLAKKAAERYRLGQRRSFAGWYLPVEVANFKETPHPNEEDRWVNQLSRFTTVLVAECRGLLVKPVSVSPYFNARRDGAGNLPGYLVEPEVMQEYYTRFLKGTGISVVMLQDGVGAGNVRTEDVRNYVEPYLLAFKKASEQASPPGQGIEFWLNVESFGSEADIRRLKEQLTIGRGRVTKTVTFDFPHHLNQDPLYTQYLAYLSEIGRR